MRNGLWFLSIGLIALVPAARADDRSLIVIFGPTTDESGGRAAHAAADLAHDWLKVDGAYAELRRVGMTEGQELTLHTASRELDDAFLDAARNGRQADLPAFLNALDKAAYAAARRPGKRLLLAVLETPASSTLAAMKGGADEFAYRLSQTVDFCRSKSINVVVLDPAPAAAPSAPALKSLATATGGALVRDPKTLASDVLVVAPVARPGSDVAAAPPPPAAPQGLPVRTHFVRIQPKRAHGAVSDLGPTSGLLLLECPFSALEFQEDDKAGKYFVQARMTEIVRNTEGNPVWQARKDVTLKEPLKKLHTRQAGSLFYMRTLQLPGGQYTVEATVEDLLANRSGSAREPLNATGSLPGLGVSDPLFVRPLNDAADRFDADQVLMYDAQAIAPVLNPVFIADQPFELRLYFVIYPDIRGATPEISLEILRNGHVEGRSQLAFNDKIRDTAFENSTLGGKSEQKHEFPYLADIRDASFGAGQYEARLTIRQGRNTVTRGLPFRVVKAGQ